MDGTSKGFLASPENPFLKNLKKRPLRRAETVGIRNYHEEQWCSMCATTARRVGDRQCASCAGTIFCETCFAESHDKGARRRHVYLRITVDPSQPEGQTGGPSTSFRSTASRAKESTPIKKEKSKEEIKEENKVKEEDKDDNEFGSEGLLGGDQALPDAIGMD